MSTDEKESDSSVDPLFCTPHFPSDMGKLHIAISLPPNIVLLYVESCWYKESDRSIHSDSWPLLILKRWTFLTAEQVLKSRQRIRKEMM